MRWRENKKSNPGTEKPTDKTPTTTESPTFNKRRKLMDSSAGQLAEAEYQLHLTEIQKEWQKPAVKRSETHQRPSEGNVSKPAPVDKKFTRCHHTANC